ncbi:hypothetical protein [Micromonospora chersina]|uniref:hypothetical protein n=1 Tax=Micromonospora chersina TaxID=47854 RepID=UPI003719919F
MFMISGAAQRRWRLTWAQRENDHRRRAYDMEAEAWRQRKDQLIRLQIEAAGFLGAREPRTGLPVDLDDDEVVYRVLPTAELVEATGRHVAGLPAPELTIAPADVVSFGHALPSGLQVVDVGVVVVTNHRVAFSGRVSRREWTFAEVMGPAHHPNVPLTLLHTTDRGRLCGLLVPPSAAVNFRFYLTLAFASSTGERAAVAAQVDALLAAHHTARPLPPLPVGPDQAPPAPLRPDRLAAAAAAAVVTLASAALAAGTFRSSELAAPPPPGPIAGGTPTTTASEPVKSTAPSGGTGGSQAKPGVPGSTPGGEAPNRLLGSRSRETTAGSAVVAEPSTHPTPTKPKPTSGLRQSTAPAPTTRRSPAGGPDDASAPSLDPVVNRCLDPLRRPLLEPLLCPRGT